jgi:hypothetical protein
MLSTRLSSSPCRSLPLPTNAPLSLPFAQVDIPLDPTPANTPRVDDLMEDGHANI